MNFPRPIILSMLLLAPVACPAVAAERPANKVSAPASPSARFTTADATQIPGRTLQPGTYTIQILDHLSDRMIVQVLQGSGPGTIFLALPKSDLAKPAANGAITLTAKGKTAMRGFAFSDGTVAEFVYPKAEAVTIAKANDTRIPAIDPASEGRVADSTLSKEDMQMVTLWMLTPTPVGPDDSGPGVKAARYQQVASVQPPRPPHRPAMAALPHTAGNMASLWLAALLSLCGAGVLTGRRLAAKV